MAFARLFVANRGEIAIRIMRAAADLGIETVAVYSEDDANSLHVLRADHTHALGCAGAAAYLDIPGLIEAARAAGADAIHPGYGFLSESGAFARAAAEAGLAFVGPRPEILELFGDKTEARITAERAGVPVLGGTRGPASVEEARAFLESLGPGGAMILKAVAGGGGRGVRVVRDPEDLAGAYERSSSEAKAAFGDAAVYAEEFLAPARHIEVQILGDQAGRHAHLGERDCTIQRRHQKLVEIAPAPGFPSGLRNRITEAALGLARAVGYDNIGTFEFLIDATTLGDDSRFAFIEANPRLQVEHTVTEAVTDIDLVRCQIELAAGRTLEELGLGAGAPPAPRGHAIELRVNMERISEDGRILPSGGTLAAFEPPSGPGVRVDTFGYAGYETSPRFDSLLAKVIAHRPGGGFPAVVDAARRALAEFRIEGVETNIPFLESLLRHPDVAAARLHTGFLDAHMEALVRGANAADRPRHMTTPLSAEPVSASSHAGARVDPDDPLAVLAYGKTAGAAGVSNPAPVAETAKPVLRPASGRTREAAPAVADGPAGTCAIRAPLQGTIVTIGVSAGDAVHKGLELLVMESMKMEHEIRAEVSGIVREIAVAPGDTVYEGHPLLFIEEGEVAVEGETLEDEIDLDHIRPDLAEVEDRRARTRDAARPEAVARRRVKGQRTARENIADLCDPGTFVEYGPLVLAAQRRRRSIEELIEKSPADGMITGVGAVNGDLFPDPLSRAVVMSYDYTVFAGTQGAQNHRKTDRMIDVAQQGRMPMILFAEGGGGRPGDTDGGGGGTRTFARFATLSGLVPMVGITSGRCFAGNASLLGCCDVIIATGNANIGMGGPAMIEGGGLGVFAPEEIGPMEIQVPNGVVDIAVADETEAVAVAKRYLSYFQGPVGTWEAPDQRLMRRIVPENRLRVYNVRDVIDTLADAGSVLELRRDFGIGMITSLFRIEGRPLGVIANNPMHLGGAIDADGADKAARFMQLCDAFDLPLLYLCDTPGIMVGPEIEKTALVRHSSRMFVIGANLSVPYFTVVLRKAYGLGAIAMAGGSYKTPYFTVSWPTGEFGGMGLEGSVKLGYRNELQAIEDAAERKAAYEEMVARAYENGKALNQASLFAVDDTIDPAETRTWVAGLLRSIRPPAPREGKKRPAIDAW